MINSPRECSRIVIDPGNLKYKLLMCHRSGRPGGTAALEYLLGREPRIQ